MIDASTICKQLGAELIEAVAQRRGSVLLKARKDGNVLAIKGYDLDETDTYDRKELLDKEAQILKEVNPFLGSSLFVDYVSLTSGNWLITQWIDGVTASEFSRSLPSDSRIRQITEMFRAAASSVRKVHEAGYLHGDIQPVHTIIPPDDSEPILIDWGLGRRIDDATPYSGGFVHYAAPEIAQGMIDKRSDIAYMISAEIYSFGAMMALCYSGQTAVAYDLSEPLPEKLASVARGHLRDFGNPESPEEAHLLAVIKQCLSFNPEDRPASLHDVEDLLAPNKAN